MDRLNRLRKVLWHETPLRYLQWSSMQRDKTLRRGQQTENNHSCDDAQIRHCDGLSVLKKRRGGDDRSPDRERGIDGFRRLQH